MVANIRPQTQPHSECYRLDRAKLQGTPGDVQRCVHGKIQLRTQVGPNARVAGPGTDWWRTLSRFWNPTLYRRAEKALDSEPPPPPPHRPNATRKVWM